MSEAEHVTVWLEQAKQGDETSLNRLHEAYFQRLVAFARRRINDSNRRLTDEEAVANRALHGMFELLREHRYTKLDNRDDLWKLLAVITRRIVKDEVEKSRAEKRGGGHVRGESVFEGGNADLTRRGLDQMASDSISPDRLALENETVRQLLSHLDETKRDIAMAKLAGYTNEEIAAQLGISKRAVSRKLAVIRDAWDS
jgi:RNA polymerase sigma factor (sigma-70 family)